MSSAKRIAVLYGGKADEHSISCISAATVMRALLDAGFEIVPIAITKSGKWLSNAINPLEINFAENPLPVVEEIEGSKPVVIDMTKGGEGFYVREGDSLVSFGNIDVVFPILHGLNGEDGTVQGMLEMLGVPYVGCGVLASAACMDKHYTKALLAQAGIEVAPGITLDVRGLDSLEAMKQAAVKWAEQIKQQHLQYPLFVKPSRAGSSFGVSKLEDTSVDALAEAVYEASKHDWRILVEQGITAREIECAVFAPNPSEEPKPSLPGEVVLDRRNNGEDQFYDFDSKYMDAQSSHVEIPAQIDESLLKKVQLTAAKAFTVVSGAGLSRVDCFVTPEGKVMVNEINTMPGFTSTSLYPMAWKAMGVDTPQLVTQLIDEALMSSQNK